MAKKVKREDQKQKESGHKLPPNYNQEEEQYRGFIIGRMERSARQREYSYPEFDDMDYSTWYESNAKAGHSYIKPKKNREDTRVVTGTTQEKEIAWISAIMNYDLAPTINAFDEEDLPVVKMGRTMEDWVRKSREIEEFEDQLQLVYKELADQGTVFVEELFEQMNIVDKEITKLDWSEGVQINKVDWETKIRKTQGKCKINLLSGLKVYLGNIREFNIDEQPYIFTRETISFQEAEAIYGDWERFDHVPRKIRKALVQDDESENSYREWTLTEIENDSVEVIKYQDKWNNEYMIMLNGVMMLPIGFPLSAISPSGSYSIAKGDLEPISKFFAYSKSFPAKTKVDQALMDEFLRLMVLKTQQSFMPPYFNNSNRILGRNIFWPGRITHNVDSDKVGPLMDARGVTSSEFNMFNLIKGIVDEKTASPVFTGDSPTGDVTATQIVEQKRQAMMKLGYSIAGVLSLHKRLDWLRIYNITSNWTKPHAQEIDEYKGKLVNVYKDLVVDAELEDGRQGVRVFELQELGEDEDFPTPDQIAEEEQWLEEIYEKPVDKVFLDPAAFKSMRLKWYITIAPSEKNSSDLKMRLFMMNLTQAMQVFGQDSVNLEHAKKRFAVLSGEDPDKFFVNPEEMMARQAQLMGGQSQGGMEQVLGGMQGGLQNAQQPQSAGDQVSINLSQ